MKRTRRRNVLREIRRAQRDPYRVSLKGTTRFSHDSAQLWLPNLTPPGTGRKQRVADRPWPKYQTNLEEFLAMPSTEKQP